MPNLTTQQLQIFKNDMMVVRANIVYNSKTISDHIAESNYSMLSAFYNDIISPDLFIWKPDLQINDISKSIIMSEFIALSDAKQRGYFAMMIGEYIDATDQNIRTSFVTIFGNNSQTKTNLIDISQRRASIFEALYTTNNVCSLYGHIVTETDVENATKS